MDLQAKKIRMHIAFYENESEFALKSCVWLVDLISAEILAESHW
jgi:hypothetical protein